MPRISRRKRKFQPVAGLEKLECRALLSSVNGTAEDTAVDEETAVAVSLEAQVTDEDVLAELLRITSVEYADGIDLPAGEDRVSAREISNEVAAQTESIVNDRELTDFVWIWGQFIDHDIDLTEGADPTEEFDIEVPTGDEFFDPFATGEETIDLTRSTYTIDEDGVRQQLNQITSLLDGSVVYGSTTERTDALRSFEGGRLLTSDGDLLPFNTDGLENAGGTSDTLFLAGDVRANENVALSSMHTIWVREHNRIADEIAEENPTLTDDEIFEEARQRVTAQIQAITFNEFLPALLGEDAIDNYTGFDATVDPAIANIFSTAAFRLGHSLLSPELQRIDADGNVIEDGNLALQSAFFTPDELIENGIDSLLRGASTQLAQELDTQIVDDVRNFLFGPPGSGGFDLVSLNIQRGRDHGLPDYNQARIDLGLEPVTDFSDITSDPEMAAALASVYESVDEIDVWVGGLAEDHVDGSSVGELFSTVIADQFERIRDGDINWYQNVFSGRELAEIENTTLADVIERNTDIANLQNNLFFAADSEMQVEDEGRDGNQGRRRQQQNRQPIRPRQPQGQNDRLARQQRGREQNQARNQGQRERVATPVIATEADSATTDTQNADEIGNAQQAQTSRQQRSVRGAQRGTPANNLAELDSVFSRPRDLF